VHILWFNWRDIKNPEAGGAEVFTHEVMRRLINKGYEITMFTSRFPLCQDYETLDGVNIVRVGGRYSVYHKARQYYNVYKNNFDFVIDEINTRPFLTPKFVKEKPVLALFHQMAKEFWFYETPFPLSYIGYYYLENKWLSYYRNIPTATVSASSKQDLISLGFKNIFMVTEGLNVQPLPKLSEKESTPTMIFIGRLKKAKLPDHAISAFSIIKKRKPDARLWVIGDGYLRTALKQLYLDGVTFYGYINGDTKNKLLARAHMILVPSVREGWGLVVTVANAMGTPAVAYNVPGLRDSV
jgi:glycosyltransferase involved in cell wall biosynthesis